MDLAERWVNEREERGEPWALRPSGNWRSLYFGRFVVGRLAERRRYWNVFVRGTWKLPLVEQNLGAAAGIRLIRLDGPYDGVTIHAESSILTALLDYIADLEVSGAGEESRIRGRAHGIQTDESHHATQPIERAPHYLGSTALPSRRGSPDATSRSDFNPPSIDPAVRELLRAAGTCPLIQSQQDSSPCGRFCRLGLEVQRWEGMEYQWVTSLGWGDPSSDLYVVGTTPRFHTIAERWGPNYAQVGVDREAHAEWFALEGFEAFQARPAARLARTTLFSRRLIRAWFAGERDERRAFVTELMLCPQVNDPRGEIGLRAMRHCFERNLGALLGLSRAPKWVVTVGQKHAEVLSSVLGMSLPRPSRQRSVASADLRQSHNARWIDVVSPAGGGGGSWDYLIAEVLRHREALRDPTDM